MLDFATIRDDQSASARGLHLYSIGGIEYEEFLQTQKLGIIESHVDYYGKFRWSSELVMHKLTQLVKLGSHICPNLTAILKQAKAAESGVTAIGD